MTLCRRQFSLDELESKWPAIWKNEHKKRIHFLVEQLFPEIDRSINIDFSRWEAQLLTGFSEFEDCQFTIKPDFFDYKVSDEEDLAWHMNFAHSDLFCVYGGPLLAQDELQCLEHPALGSIAEALRKLSANSPELAPKTMESGQPTPCLISNVPRVCSLDTSPSPLAPNGLYGNAFAAAEWESISEALTIFESATLTNIIAMEAPAGGSGTYSASEIRQILTTAVTGFHATVNEAESTNRKAEIHTGFWGCGAYGGNRLLMVLLQCAAASASGVRHLVFHTGNQSGAQIASEAIELFAELQREKVELIELPAFLEKRQFFWGKSDGN